MNYHKKGSRMYNIQDKNSIIKDIQLYLNTVLQKKDADVLRVNGNYDQATRSAIGYYRKMKGFADKDDIDYNTFTSLYDDYQKVKMRNHSNGNNTTNINFPIGYGASHRDLTIINTMLHDISSYYFGASDVNKDSYFSKNSEVAVEEIRKIFGMEASGLIDTDFYNRLLEENKLINKFKKEAKNVL